MYLSRFLHRLCRGGRDATLDILIIEVKKFDYLIVNICFFLNIKDELKKIRQSSKHNFLTIRFKLCIYRDFMDYSENQDTK